MRALLVKYEWMSDALCREIGDEPFFSDDAGLTKRAKKICHRCPVIAECLQYALDDRDLVGVFGGTTDKDRRSIRRRKANVQSSQAERQRI